MPWIALGLGVAGSIYSRNQAQDAADDAAAREAAAGEQSIEFLEEGRTRAREGLQPYADQEAIARNQLMRQMGLVAPMGGTQMGYGAPMTGPGGGGYGMVPLGGPGDPADQSAGAREGGEFQRFMEQMLGDQIAIAMRAGYSRDKAVSEGARRAEGFLQDLKRSGDLPADYITPSLSELTEYGHDMGEANAYAFKGQYGLNPETGRGISGTGPESMEVIRSQLQGFGGAEALLPQYFAEGPMVADETGYMPGGVAQMGGPTGMAAGQEYLPGPRTMMGDTGIERRAAPGVMGGTELMDMYGATRTPGGFAERYYRDVETPGYAEGWDYMMNPAYSAMIEENTRNINQAAAGAGQLYSGRRGEALRDMSAGTQMDFMRNLQDVRAQDLARRGELMGEQVSREDQYLVNYLNMLQSLGSPTTATNIANIETGQSANLAQIPGEVSSRVNEANLAGVEAGNTAIADMGGALGEFVSDPNVRRQVASLF